VSQKKEINQNRNLNYVAYICICILLLDCHLFRHGLNSDPESGHTVIVRNPVSHQIELVNPNKILSGHRRRRKVN